MPVLPESFYTRTDVVEIARDLIGKYLFTEMTGCPVTGGIIIETEAYAGPEDRASHAYNNRRTKRTEVMFAKGGVSYVYLCYGVHHLLNVVTNIEGIPQGVLIRSIQPTHGIPTMLERRRKKKLDPTLTKGPGATTQALGITLHHNQLDLRRTSPESPLWIEDRGLKIKKKDICIGTRIGIEYAKEDALLPWRFWTNY